MAIYAKDPGSSFTPVSEGLHPAVCCDVVDLGFVDDGFGEKQKVKIVFQVEERHPETGKPLTVSRRFSLSLHPKAALRMTLDTWRGKPFTRDELALGFDLERLLGAPGQVQVTHRMTDDGRTFANIVAVVPPARGVPPLTVRDYTREQDRATVQGTQAAPGATVDEQDEIPF
jgi:hypothetical protein